MFRFTIRDVLCMTVVVALIISWIHERYAMERMRAKLHESVDEVENLRGQIFSLNARIHSTHDSSSGAATE